MGRTQYEEFLKELRDNIQKAKSDEEAEDFVNAIHSNTERVNIMHKLINEPDQTFRQLKSKGGESEPVVVETQPVKRYRNALKSMVTDTFGISDEEASKLDEQKFSKEHAESLIDVGDEAMSDYLNVGRTLNLPLTDEQSAKMSIRKAVVEEKEEATNKIEKCDDGSYRSVPTGKTIKTDKHSVLKSSNKVPPWLKHDVTNE